MENRLEVRLLGGVSFLLNGRPVNSTPTRVAQAIFIYLLHQVTPVERERLVDLFFQASEPKQAAANFRSTLSRMRKELRPFLDINSRTIHITPDANIWIDAVQFAQCIKKRDLLEDTLSLYQGDFLAGFYLRDAPEFEQWVLVEQERLRLMALEGYKRLVGQHQEAGRYWDALQAVNQLLAIDPLIEEAQRTKLLLLARTGQREKALQHFEDTAVLYEEELGLALSPETTALRGRIGGLKIPPPGNIPAPTDQFIGRAAELGTLLDLLAQPERRLITLFGVGGTGKTRLAYELGRTVLAENSGLFLDGVYVVSMVGVAPGASPDDVALHMLQALGFVTSGLQSPIGQLIDALKNREMLLIVDNFEHLIRKNSAFLAELLQKAAALTLVVTSRERLNLHEETVFDLDGLPFSGAKTLDTDAARLFVNHAQRHRFTFKPAAPDVPPIVEVCQLLEGSPLGIELAAGSVRNASVSEIALQIKRNLGELTSPLQNVPPRHRSLRAVFLHSWRLLDPALRPVYANLSVFPTWFDAEAARSIAGASVDQLAQFVDKALLKERDGRFSIHPILREFATEQLATDQRTALCDGHAGYFSRFIADRSETLHRPSYMETMPDLLAAYDDLVAAWRWSIGRLVEDESEAVWQWVEWMRRPLIRLHFQRSWFYAARGLFGAARQRLENAGWHLENAPKRHRLLHAQLTVTESNCTRIMGDVVSVIEPTQKAAPLLQEQGAIEDLFDATNLLIGCYMQLRNFDSVPNALEELEAMAAQIDKPAQYGVYYVSHSYFADYMGDTEESLLYAERALTVFRSMEDTFYEAIVLDGIARRLFTLGRPDEAIEVLHEAYALADENDQTLTKAFIQRGIASYYREQGELDEAESAAALSRELFTEVNDLRYLVDIDYLEAQIAYAREEWATMTRFLIATLQRAMAYTIPRHKLNVLAYLPILHWQRGAQDEALALFRCLEQHEPFNDEQYAIVDDARDLLGIGMGHGKTAVVESNAFDAEAVLNGFLREGLRWF